MKHFLKILFILTLPVFLSAQTYNDVAFALAADAVSFSGTEPTYTGTLSTASAPNQLPNYPYNITSIVLGDLIVAGSGGIYEVTALGSSTANSQDVTVSRISTNGNAFAKISPTGRVFVGRTLPTGRLTGYIENQLGISPIIESIIANYNSQISDKDGYSEMDGDTLRFFDTAGTEVDKISLNIPNEAETVDYLQGAEYAYMRLQNGDEIPNIDQAGITVLQLGTSQTNAGFRYQSPMYQFFREIGVPINQPGFQQTSQLNSGESSESEGAGALTFSGDWVHYDGNTGGRSLNMTHAKGASVGAQIKISTYAAGGVNTDKGIVYFRRQTNGGSFKVKTQNAGSYFPVVSTAGTEGEIDSVQYNYTSGKVDFIIEIETVGADSVEILGASLFSKNEIGFTFHKAGHNGLGAFELAALSNYDFTRQLQLLEPVPDVVIIEHGTNDFDYDTSVLSINYDTIISRIQSALPAAQILLLSPPDASLAFKNGKTIEEFEDFQKRAADRYKCSWFSQKNTLGDLKTAFNFTGIYAPDSIHLERAGGYMVTRAIFKHLFPGLTQNNSLSSMPGEGATVGQVPKWDGSKWIPQDDTDTGINNVNSVASNIPKMNSASQVGLSPMYAVGDYTGFGGATAPDAAVYIPPGKEGAAISGGLGVGFERINYREALYRYETTRNLLWNGTGYDLEHNAGTGWLFLNHIQPGGVNEEYSIWSAPSGSSPVTLTRHYVLKGQTGFFGLGLPYPENPSQRLHVRGNIRNEGDYYDSNNSKGNDGQVLRSGTTGSYWDDELFTSNTPEITPDNAANTDLRMQKYIADDGTNTPLEMTSGPVPSILQGTDGIHINDFNNSVSTSTGSVTHINRQPTASEPAAETPGTTATTVAPVNTYNLVNNYHKYTFTASASNVVFPPVGSKSVSFIIATDGSGIILDAVTNGGTIAYGVGTQADETVVEYWSDPNTNKWYPK